MNIASLAEGVRFELTREQSPLPVFKTGALNHSATLPASSFELATHIAHADALATFAYSACRNQSGPIGMDPKIRRRS